MRGRINRHLDLGECHLSKRILRRRIVVFETRAKRKGLVRDSGRCIWRGAEPERHGSVGVLAAAATQSTVAKDAAFAEWRHRR